MSKSSIVIILPRGEAIRNLFYTGALDEVAEHAELTVLSIETDESIRREMREKFPRLLRLQEFSDRWLVRFIREQLDLAHGRWLWSRAAQVRWEWRDQEAVTIPQKLKRSGKKLIGYPFANRGGLELLSNMESAASRSFPSTDEFTKLFREIKPSLVFNASHVHSRVALPAVHAAQSMGIPTATFIFSWDNLTSQGRIYPQYDHYLVWNEKLRDDLLRIYDSINPDRVHVTGTPQFDFHFRPEFYWSREEFCEKVGADPARPIVLYSTGMANHVFGEPRFAERIGAMLREMTEFGPPQLLVRILPKGPQGGFDEVRRRFPDILIPEIKWERKWLTPTIEDVYMLTNTLRHCSLGINVASTISLELCMFDKPVINVGYLADDHDLKTQFDNRRYYQFEHYRPVIESGAIDLARSEEEMREMILNALRSPEPRAEKRKALLQSFFGDRLDGKSASRVARTLLEIAEL